MTTSTSTDCRTEEGITVGLVDALIMICRVLAPRLNSPGFSQPVAEALRDFWADRDVIDVQRSARGCITGEKKTV